jgi:transcriptional regulator with XRE-family HTH domain
MSTEQFKFGSYLKSLRIERKISLREFSINAKADPGNVSRIERGVLSPPQNREILVRFASALGLTEGSDEWYALFDHAAADRGLIPADILQNDRIVYFLPAFFRTLRGTKPTDEEMGKIIELIRKS